VKAENLRLGGVLKRLPIVECKWDCITMDPVEGFPQTSKGVDNIWVITDRLTKSAYFLVVQSSFSAERLAQINIRKVVHLYCVPVSIILHRGA